MHIYFKFTRSHPRKMCEKACRNGQMVTVTINWCLDAGSGRVLPSDSASEAATGFQSFDLIKILWLWPFIHFYIPSHSFSWDTTEWIYSKNAFLFAYYKKNIYLLSLCMASCERWCAPLRRQGVGGCSNAVRHSHFSRGHSQNPLHCQHLVLVSPPFGNWFG